MKKYPHNDQIQYYGKSVHMYAGVPTHVYVHIVGMFCWATSFVPIDTLNHSLSEESLLIYGHVMNIISSTKTDFPAKHKIFALNVLYNILSTHPGMHVVGVYVCVCVCVCWERESGRVMLPLCVLSVLILTLLLLL